MGSDERGGDLDRRYINGSRGNTTRSHSSRYFLRSRQPVPHHARESARFGLVAWCGSGIPDGAANPRGDHMPLEDRATVCLAPEFSPAGNAAGGWAVRLRRGE